MTKNVLNIQTTSIKRTDFQTDLALQFGHVTEKKEKADPSQNHKSVVVADSLSTSISQYGNQ
jgi:hypothetical protein